MNTDAKSSFGSVKGMHSAYIGTNLLTGHKRGMKQVFNNNNNFSFLEYEVEECVQILRTRKSHLNLFQCIERERERESARERKNERKDRQREEVRGEGT